MRNLNSNTYVLVFLVVQESLLHDHASLAKVRVISPWMGDCNNKIGVILRSGGLSNRELDALETRIRQVCLWTMGGGGNGGCPQGEAAPVFRKELLLSFGSNLPWVGQYMRILYYLTCSRASFSNGAVESTSWQVTATLNYYVGKYVIFNTFSYSLLI